MQICFPAVSHVSAMSVTDGRIHRWLRAAFKWRSLEICTDRCVLCTSATTSQAVMYKAAMRSEAHLKSSTLRRKLLTCCASTLQKLRKSCSPTKCAAAACMASMSRSPCCRMWYLYSRPRALNLRRAQLPVSNYPLTRSTTLLIAAGVQDGTARVAQEQLLQLQHTPSIFTSWAGERLSDAA